MTYHSRRRASPRFARIDSAALPESNQSTISVLSLSLILLFFFIFLSSGLRKLEKQGFPSGEMRPVTTNAPAEEPAAIPKEKTQGDISSEMSIDCEALGCRVTSVADALEVIVPAEHLFESGASTVSRRGELNLRKIAQNFRNKDYFIEIEGHTDDRPVKGDRYASNWELSTARAVSVLRLMLAAGVPAERLSAGGRGEFHPVASNENEEGRAANRRVVITLRRSSFRSGLVETNLAEALGNEAQ